MKKSNFASMGLLVAAALVWTACKTDSSSNSSDTTSDASVTKPTLAILTGTWVRTSTEGITKAATKAVNGTETKKRTMTFAADGAFTEINVDKIVHTDGSADTIESTASRGTVSISDSTVTFTFTDYYETSSELTSTEGISWTTAPMTKQYPGNHNRRQTVYRHHSI